MVEDNGGPASAGLLPHHRAMLAASAIGEDVWSERGVFSVESKAELEQLGFGRSLQIVPTLVFPIHGVVAGEAPWYVHRPDITPVKDGRPRKYLIPAGRKMSLDIHPRVRVNLSNPAFPLFVTEGQKKVDALITAGARAVAGVIGVWNWRGRNDHDGLAMLADWEFVALKEGRQVYVVFDSDVMLKEPVRLAMERMGAALKRIGASVAYVYLPAGEGGEKVGADDFLAAGHSLDDIASLTTTTLRAPSTSVGVSVPPEPRAQVHNAPELAHEPDILTRFVGDIRRVGHVGEERATKLIYLIATSRLLDKVVSGVMKGPSAAGKSVAVERVLGFFPGEAYYALTGMSERALAYDDEPLKHRMLVVYEAAGMENDLASYLIRSLLSEGCLRYKTVEHTDEGLKPRLIEREGPTGLLCTTTAATLHPENETRMLSIPVDDTREQTRMVMQAIASENGRKVDLSEWHTLQCWLADGERRVTVPYAGYLADNILPLAVRLRRDFGAILGLIRAHALLHRATRDVDEHGWIVATAGDYMAVRELVNDLISEGISATVRPTTRETVEAVVRLAGDDGKYVTTARLASELKLDVSAVGRRVNVAIAAGYLRNDEDKRNKPRKLATGDPLPEDEELLPTLDDWLCSCATPIRGTDTPTDVDVERAERLAAEHADLFGG
jgi:hypothetical protein